MLFYSKKHLLFEFILISFSLLQFLNAQIPEDWRKNLPEPILDDHKEWIDLYYDTWRIANTKKVKYGEHYIFDTAFSKSKIWLWDTVWISHFGIYVQDAQPKITNPMYGFDLFYSAQREDGCIPHVWSDKGRHSWQVHNPIFTMGELNFYRHTGDKSRMKRILPILDNFYFYLKKKYSYKDGFYRSFDWNNGMDNRPLNKISIDSTCQQAMVANQLREIAEIVGDKDRANKFAKEHKIIVELINNRMWSEEDKFYVDLDGRRKPYNVWSVASYWALISKIASANRAEFMKNHLFDPENFKTPMMVPTLGRKSRAYDGDGGDYWRGSVWIPANAMVIKGLMEYGYIKEAREIAISGLNGILKTWKNKGTLYENYDQEKVGSPGEKSKPDFVGWTGVQPIAILIEYIIGIRTNAPENKIKWKIRMNKRHGVKRLKWGLNYSREVSLEALPGPNQEIIIKVSSNAPFSLEVETGSNVKAFAVVEGKGQIFKIVK